MRLPKLAIENHQFTNVIIILLVLFGLVSFMTMPRSEDPQVSPAGSSVIVIYPGANPTDVEELIVEPLEEAINELEDIKDIKSYAQDGLALIETEFISGTDPDDKYSDVVQKVNRVRNELPDGIIDFNIIKWSISEVQVMQIALLSDSVDYRELEREADNLKKIVERIPGIKKAKTWAFPEQEIRIALNLEKMAQLNIPLNQVMGAIQSANKNIPGGYIDVGSKKYNIQTSGSYKTLEDIQKTIVTSAMGHIVYLKDIAEVNFSYADNTYYARFNDKTAVFVTASQKVGTNIFDIFSKMRPKIEQFEENLLDEISLDFVFDQSESVSHRMNGFFSNLLQGLFLVGIVVLLAIGLRASAIVILAIPISIMIGIGFVELSGFGLEQMSITGLVIALGLLVDNAIVVIENISRYMKMGYSRVEAAIQGTSQIAWAVVSSTATTVLAFIPILLMQNITGDFIRSMPTTVVYTLSASLLISLVLTPNLSNKFLKIEQLNKESYFRRLLNKEIENRYRKTLDYALRNPKKVLLIALSVFILSFGLVPFIGISFFPKAEKPQFMINVDTPDGTSLEQTDKVTQHIDSVLAKEEHIEHYAINIGHGNPRIYYNVIPKNITATHAQIFVQVKFDDLDMFYNLIKKLRKEFAGYPGAKIAIKEFEQGPPVEAPIAIRIIGKELSILKEIARDVEEFILNVPGTINVNNPLGTSKTDLHVNINRDKAGMLGVSLVEIDRTVRATVAGLKVSSFHDNKGKEYDIVVRLPFKDKIKYSDLDRIMISSMTGNQIPLKQLAKIEFKASPMQINHYNLDRNVTVTADVSGTISVDTATREVIKKLDSYNWPNNYRYDVGGEQESREESFGGMLQAIIIALIGIFGVLVLQFRSYSQPFIVFSALPLAIIGSLIALFITGYSFSFTAFIGIASLVGIVINNSIILVDYTNQLRRDGKEFIAALKEAGETRFIPIVLTTATTVGGLLPLTVGGGTLWAPMGWTIIGGLLMSTFLTLLVVPVLYKMYTR